jgi:hypothetical protein
MLSDIMKVRYKRGRMNQCQIMNYLLSQLSAKQALI